MQDEHERALAIVASHMEGANSETRRVLTRIVNEIASLSDKRAPLPTLQTAAAKIRDLRQVYTAEELAKAFNELEEETSREGIKSEDLP